MDLLSEDVLQQRLAGKTLIYVEDDKDTFETVEKWLNALAGLNIAHATNNGASLDEALKNNPDAIGILSDIERPSGHAEGLKWANQYTISPDALPVMLTSHKGNYKEDSEALGIPFIRKSTNEYYGIIATWLAAAMDQRARREELRTKIELPRDPLKPDESGQNL